MQSAYYLSLPISKLKRQCEIKKATSDQIYFDDLHVACTQIDKLKNKEHSLELTFFTKLNGRVTSKKILFHEYRYGFLLQRTRE